MKCDRLEFRPSQCRALRIKGKLMDRATEREKNVPWHNGNQVNGFDKKNEKGRGKVPQKLQSGLTTKRDHGTGYNQSKPKIPKNGEEER